MMEIGFDKGKALDCRNEIVAMLEKYKVPTTEAPDIIASALNDWLCRYGITSCAVVRIKPIVCYEDG